MKTDQSQSTAASTTSWSTSKQEFKSYVGTSTCRSLLAEKIDAAAHPREQCNTLQFLKSGAWTCWWDSLNITRNSNGIAFELFWAFSRLNEVFLYFGRLFHSVYAAHRCSKLIFLFWLFICARGCYECDIFFITIFLLTWESPGRRPKKLFAT